MVDVVVGKTAATFIHARDVHSACGKVAGDLDIADEWAVGGQLSLVGEGPGETVVSREDDFESAIVIEIVPGNVHVSVMGRGWIVVRPARLAIVLKGVVNARTSGPGDPTVSGLPGADARKEPQSPEARNIAKKVLVGLL